MILNIVSLLLPALLFILRVFIAFLLIVAGVGKLMNLRGFREILIMQAILPKRLVPLFSLLLPILEISISIGILFNLYKPIFEVLALSLFLIFAATIAINLFRGRKDIPCGCFSDKVDTISWRIVLRNLVFASLSLLLLNQWGIGLLFFGLCTAGILVFNIIESKTKASQSFV